MGFASSKWTPDTTCPVQSVTRRLMDSRIMWEERSPGDPLATNAGVTLPTVPIGTHPDAGGRRGKRGATRNGCVEAYARVAGACRYQH